MRNSCGMRKIVMVGLAVGGFLGAQGQSEKRRIAIYDFDYSSVKSEVVKNLGADSNVGHTAAEMLLSPLIESGAYEVMDRSRVEAIMKEQNLKFSSRFDSSQAVAYGKILQVDAIVAGTVNDLSVEVVEKVKGVLGVGRKTSILKVTVDLTAQMISTETGQIYLAPAATGEVTEEIGSQDAGAVRLPGSRTVPNQPTSGAMGTTTYGNVVAPAVRKAIKQALDRIAKDMIVKAPGLPKRVMVTRAPGKAGPGLAAAGVSSSLGEKLPVAGAAAAAARKPITAMVMDVSNGSVFIDKGRIAGVQAGDSFEVRHYLKTVTNSAGKAIKLDQKIGVLKITEVNDEWASGTYEGQTPPQKNDTVRLP